MKHDPRYVLTIRRALNDWPHGEREALACAAGIPYGSLRNFKAGRRGLSPARLDSLAQAMGLVIVVIRREDLPG